MCRPDDKLYCCSSAIIYPVCCCFHRVSHWPGSHQVGYAGRPVSPRDLHIYLLSTRITRVHHHVWHFIISILRINLKYMASSLPPFLFPRPTTEISNGSSFCEFFSSSFFIWHNKMSDALQCGLYHFQCTLRILGFLRSVA